MGTQIKKHYWPNGTLSHEFVILNGKIVTAKKYNINGDFVDNMPWLYSFKIQNNRYYFWNQANHGDSVEIIDDYQ